MTEKRPVDILREAITLLTSRKLAPTPENYRVAYHEIAGTPDPAASAAAAEPAPAPASELLEQSARLIENTLPALGTDDPRLTQQARELVAALRAPAPDLAASKSMLANFNHRLSFAAEDQAEIRATLLKLLHQVFEGIGEFSLDDRWLKRRVEELVTAAEPPLTLRRLDDLGRRLKDVMFKQTEAKGRTLEAQEQMRQMLATFIERLSQMTESTGRYHDKMETSARQIEQAASIEEIAPVLKEVVSATRGIAEEAKKTRDELRSMREKTQATEKEIAALHEKLDRVSAQARHDVLTGALNRKGLDEALERELAIMRRKGSSLCVALLDIDNFKKLNDSRGHDTGDAALAHLAAVTRESMRLQDTFARYGGEEFVVLMPDTVLEDGIDAMTRLQRALTRRFFMAGMEKILITFSAGVVQLVPEESGQDAVKRADKAMYLAKRAGRNRVVGA
ncbi:MAG TPA: diguanylate cyclase [Burkholderiales bacterium]|nr:diguanylate cyclase [Burkholderiales bacterium]